MYIVTLNTVLLRLNSKYFAMIDGVVYEPQEEWDQFIEVLDFLVLAGNHMWCGERYIAAI